MLPTIVAVAGHRCSGTLPEPIASFGLVGFSSVAGATVPTPRYQVVQRRPHQRLQVACLLQLPLRPAPVPPYREDAVGVGLGLFLSHASLFFLLFQLLPHSRRQGCQIAASTHRRALFRRHALAPPTLARSAASAARPVATSPLRCTSAGSALGGCGNSAPRASSRHTSA